MTQSDLAPDLTLISSRFGRVPTAGGGTNGENDQGDREADPRGNAGSTTQRGDRRRLPR